MTKCAVSRYSGSRSACSSRSRPSGSATCSSGRLHVVAQPPEQVFRRGAQVDHLAVRRAAAARLASRSTAPPPVASTRGAPAASSASTCCSMSRKRASPSRSKKSRIEQPRRCSISVVGIDERQLQPLRQAGARQWICRTPGRPTRCDRPRTSARHAGASARGVAVGNHLRGDEDQHFCLLAVRLRVLEQVADSGQFAQHRHARLRRSVSVSSKMPPMTTVPPFSTSTCGLDVLGVDRDARRRGLARGCPC